MPRRNRPKKPTLKTEQPAELELTYEQMAQALVERGLASPVILIGARGAKR